MAEGIGRLCQILKRPALPPGEETDRNHGHQDDADGGGQEDVGNLGQHRPHVGGGGGHNDDAGIAAGRRHRQGHQKPLFIVQALDKPRGTVGSLGENLFQVAFVDVQPQMLTAEHAVGADAHLALGIADHRVGAGNLAGNIQVH